MADQNEVTFDTTDEAQARAMADNIAIARAESDAGLGETSKFVESVEKEDEDRQSAIPEWLPEKFVRRTEAGDIDYQASSEAMAKAHSELEKNFHKDRQEKADDPAEETEEKPEGETPLIDGEFWNSLVAEYNDKRELSDDSMEILRNIGIPDTIVQDYIAGQEARASAYANKVVEGVGGLDQYEQLVGWAADALDINEIRAFDRAVESGDLLTAQMAVRDLRTRYEAANGSIAGLAVQGTPSTSSSQGYGSRAEMTAAIQDPRYAKDAAYREQVMRRIGASDF